MNMFHINNLDCFRFLPTLILPQRLRAIRFLHISVYLKEFPQTSASSGTVNYNYNDLWQTALSMRGLHKLHVQITAPAIREVMWKNNEAAWLEPTKSFMHLKAFKLFLPISAAWLSSDVNVGYCDIKPIQGHTTSQVLFCHGSCN